VSDVAEAPAPGAKVTLKNTATGVTATKSSAEDGVTLFSPLPRGEYVLEVSKPGFRSVNVSKILLNVDQRQSLEIVLDVATVVEAVEVVGNVSSMQTEQGSIGQVISGAQAVELPLAGRRYTELALLAPGVTASTLEPVTRGPGWLVANGNYHTQNNFLLDGIDNNQGTTNAQGLSAQVVQPSPDALAEFKVQTNSFSAEFGRSAGAVINATLKSGTNQVHGSGWLYNRDQSLAANNWVNNVNGIPRPQLRWNQYGGTIGGPLVRNKLFYFGHYEGFQRAFADTIVTSVPTAAQRTGLFAQEVRDPLTGQNFPDRRIPANRIDPLAAKLSGLFPTPNAAGRTVAGRPVDNYAVTRDGDENTQKFDVRTDLFANERDSLTARFSYLRQSVIRLPIFEGLGDGVGNQGSQYNDNQSLALTWNRTLSPRATNTLRYGVNRTFAEFAHATANASRADEFGFLGIPSDMLQVGGLPLIDLDNYNDLGTRNFRPQFQRPWLNQIIDTVGIQAGAHAVRLGGDVRLKNNSFVDITRRTPAYRFQGQYSGDSLADMILGLPEFIQLNTVPEVNQLQNAAALFFQDDWKVRRNLTLNLGLRYEYTTPYFGTGENVNINFNPATQGLVFPTTGDSYTVRPDKNNFGPRLGMAWSVSDKTVLRAGYGIFYNGEDIYGSEANLPLNPPQLIQVALLRQGTTPPATLSQPIPAGALSNFNTRNVSLRTREQNQRSALIQQWNIALQRQLGTANTLEVAYVANRGRNLFGLFERNQTAFSLDGNVATNRPFPLWQGIQTGATRARSWYDSLQTKFERRMSNGLFALVSYTYASALDEAGAWSEGNSPQVLDDFRAERGPMTQNARHRLTAATNWQLPIGRKRTIGANWNRVTDAVLGGWMMSHILTYRTGLPVNVSLNQTGTDPVTGARYAFLGRNGGALRPNLVGDPHTGIDPKQDRFRFLDPNAFRVQPVNTAGNAQRNVAVGPEFFTLDMTLTKRFAISERLSVDLRGEAFNLFNTVNFRNPNGAYGGSTFGVISSAFDGRQMQLAIRVAF
jgi:hypothetical protein